MKNQREKYFKINIFLEINAMNILKFITIIAIYEMVARILLIILIHLKINSMNSL